MLWVSTSLETRGGISTFVRTMQQTPLWDLWGIHHVATHCEGGVLRRLVAFTVGAQSVVWELAVRQPDVVHLHMASYGSFARKSLLAWAATLARVPVVIHIHGGEFHTFFARSPRFVQVYIRSTLNVAVAVIALGERWAVRLQQIAPRAEITVVANAVRSHSPVLQRAVGEPVRVIFLGDLSESKGAFLLLEAWRGLMDELGNQVSAELLLAGAGDVERARRQVERLGMQQAVQVLGWVEPSRVQALLAASQVLVLPSRNEGQPMAVLEAMAHGLCLVVTDVGGLPDLVDPSCGILVPVDDRAALTRALREVITDDDARASLGAHAFRRVKERFDVDVNWHVLDAIYAKAAR